MLEITLKKRHYDAIKKYAEDVAEKTDGVDSCTTSEISNLSLISRDKIIICEQIMIDDYDKEGNRIPDDSILCYFYFLNGIPGFYAEYELIHIDTSITEQVSANILNNNIIAGTWTAEDGHVHDIHFIAIQFVFE